ncbi:SsgA family sporulation/cell division regulator [Nocardioides sp. zg-1228]|uniref:SsgA family sporulation/cell division regulator n=1 Tax=Nocardioides sp. zg-1228 TaxID=2763008 RepID=UPI0016424F4C|nr:SsgA family sporulation/cell division regulator [Nocardioides sp. zg-1228]MBC2933572.1 SsgA family sporulation/cell division regulator [Nocardioides sp. zg-1228]QSF56301.1 SsgA family sporulation/cell division regulator [Nocardioides sp. zg-1228]
MNISGSGHTLSDVALDITVECIDDRGIRHEIDTVLSYAGSDPFAVAMTFVTSDGNLVWTFGRDLLIRGAESPAGDGDVHVSPASSLSGRAMVSIELSSPDGHLVLLARASDVLDFLARTIAVIAPGAESDSFDADLLISQLLAS